MSIYVYKEGLLPGERREFTLVKIGRGDTQSRITTSRTGNPRPLLLVNEFKAIGGQTEAESESQVHRALDRFRVRAGGGREWFSLLSWWVSEIASMERASSAIYLRDFVQDYNHKVVRGPLKPWSNLREAAAYSGCSKERILYASRDFGLTRPASYEDVDTPWCSAAFVYRLREGLLSGAIKYHVTDAEFRRRCRETHLTRPLVRWADEYSTRAPLQAAA